MAILLTTISSISINDLGGRSFVHPVVDYDLTDEFSYDEVRNSFNLGLELDAGNVTLVNDGVNVNDSNELKLVQPKQTSINSGNIVGGVIYDESSIYRTSILTANTDDLLIPNVQNYSIIVITISKDIELTGILRSTISEYQNLRIVLGNTNNKKLKLKKNDGDSIPSARFYMEKDVELKEGQWWDFLSHKDLNRWTGQGKIR